jgi:hypothetical protein
MTAIEIENLSKIYGKVRALDGLNLCSPGWRNPAAALPGWLVKASPTR